MEKACTKCGVVKPLEDFGRRSDDKTKPSARCRACKKEYDDARWLRNHPARARKRAEAQAAAARGEKQCPKCLVTKELDAFPRKTRAKDGRHWMCRACISAYHMANRERDLARSAAWEVANKERSRASNLAWKRLNHERHLAANAAWSAANPDRRRASHHNARAKRRVLERGECAAPVAVGVLAVLLAEPCVYCGRPAEHVDHLRPLSRGGAHVEANLVAACAFCNLSKHSKLLTEWDPVRVQHAVDRSAKAATEMLRLFTELVVEAA